MKRILFVIVLSIFGVGAFAQNSEVNKAEMNFNKGILDKAKEHIDIAANHEKTSNKSKTHLLRGSIYNAIFLDSGKYTTLVENPQTIAQEAFKKAKELETKKESAKVDSVIKASYNLSLNVGAQAYQSKDYKTASKYFKAASQYVPADTTAALYLAIAAQQSQDYETAKEAYKNLIKMGNKNPDYYTNLIYISRNIDKDETRALELVREAKKEYPNEKNFAQEELNILIATNKIDEAKASLQEAIQREPNNANYHYNLAFMYDQTKEVDKAMEAYQKAININPEYFEAHFNLGVIHYNKAADILREVNAMDLSTYNKTGKKKEQEGIQKLKEALPYFEKAYQLNPNDIGVLETLGTIYSRLKMDAQAEKIKKELDSKSPQ